MTTVATLKDIAYRLGTAEQDLDGYYTGTHTLDEALELVEQAAADLRAYIREARS